MTPEQIESKVQSYEPEIKKGYPYSTETDAIAFFSLRKLAELELRIEALEGNNDAATLPQYEYPKH